MYGSVSSPSSNFTSSAAVPLPSVKVQMAVPTRTATSASSRRRGGAGTSDAGTATVASSISALQRCCDLQAKRQKQQEEEESARTAVENRSRSTSPLPGMMMDGSGSGLGGMGGMTTTYSGVIGQKGNWMRGKSQQHVSFDAGAAAADFSASSLHQFGGGGGTNTSASGVFNPPAAGAPAAKQNQMLQQVLISDHVMEKKKQLEKRYQTGYAAFEFALETAMQRLEKRMQKMKNSSSSSINSKNSKERQEDRWRVLADCLTSSTLNTDLHKVCADIQTTIDELAKYRAHQALQEARAAGSGGRAAFSMMSPTNNKRKREQQAKNRLNGMQTAMAAMLLEQTLAVVADAAPYSKAAMQWMLDTILGSIYVSYDIVRSDLSRSFETLYLGTGGSGGDQDDGGGGGAAGQSSKEDPSLSSAAALGGGILSQSAVKLLSGGDSGLTDNSDNFLGKGNTEKLISRFYGKTFFQSVRSLSATAAAHAEHAEDIERAKTRQSRVLERATSYWARYSMRRVLGAWRGFAKNEKIERALREELDGLQKQNRYLKELNDQREKELNLSSMGSIAGSSQEALQLQVRELQRALEFERRRATRAEAALAVRIVEEGGGGGGFEGGGSPQGAGDSSSSFGQSPSVDIAALRSELSHYRAVAVEACRLGDIDLHELERAVSAQTNVLARGMH